ncbi:hypothetical protein GCM10010974_17780 [Brevibacterium sediminis]|uniref:Uncharacterized protein n=1 Tax=Brevibacterium sediminis TaxID=1857024 RepID=A0ABQ1M7K4_9MICO|nr:hypothetical protein GCM10010974_17780 [Brevibacterium sediminis]
MFAEEAAELPWLGARCSVLGARCSVKARPSTNRCGGLEWHLEENGADVRDCRILFSAFLDQVRARKAAAVSV